MILPHLVIGTLRGEVKFYHKPELFLTYNRCGTKLFRNSSSPVKKNSVYWRSSFSSMIVVVRDLLAWMVWGTSVLREVLSISAVRSPNDLTVFCWTNHFWRSLELHSFAPYYDRCLERKSRVQLYKVELFLTRNWYVIKFYVITTATTTNGMMECQRGQDIGGPRQFYKRCWDILGVNHEENLDCWSQKPFNQ